MPDGFVLPAQAAEATKPTTTFPALASFARRAGLLLLLGLLWEGFARYLDNDLVAPGLIQVLQAWGHDMASGELPARIGSSMELLAMGFAIGLPLAALFTVLAVASRTVAELLSMLTAMFNPLPAIALLPLALLWFGLGAPSLVFVIVHSVLWAVALNAYAGFRAVPPVLIMVGQSAGLSTWRRVVLILVPAAFPAILTGLKMAWAFAWRTLIAAELVFGVTARSGGLGWFIFEKRNQLETAHVFAGLLTVIAIGLAVDLLLFRTIERATLERWGMIR